MEDVYVVIPNGLGLFLCIVQLAVLHYFWNTDESVADRMKEQQERRRQKGFTYVWDQVSYNPITGAKVCHIHFEFKDGTRMNKAFTYEWRLWTLPEITELLTEAGFKNVTVYWEGDDGDGGGSGIFRPSTKGEACACHVS
jgi:hypothetical protein